MTTRRLDVLIVSAQFPFPPRSGFCMRVHQLAHRLAERHDVTLLSYARPDQRADVQALREQRQMRVEAIEREDTALAAKRAAQAASLASRHPYSCRAIHSREMQEAIDRLCAERAFDVIQVEASLLCAFRFPEGPALVLDEHNIEYEVFERMHEGEASLPRRVFNRLEHRRFRHFEQAWWRRVDGIVVTSEREERIVAAHAPTTPTVTVPNGVDLDVFRPSGVAPEPRTLVFNGILDYRPNLDAAQHLVEEIWPRIRRRCPDARLAIVGRTGTADLRRLEAPGVEITGEVPDVRPHLQSAAVTAVPIRMGGGTRLKVVEGLSMGNAMVSTTLGCEGIAVRDGEHLMIADDPAAFAERVLELFDDADRRAALGQAGRALMERDYSWALATERLEELLGKVAPAPRSTPRKVAVEVAGVSA